jgi:hypothetical protein
MMNKWLQFTVGVLAAGAIQFGLLAGTGATGLILYAGIVGAMGTAAASLLKQLPQREWTEDERADKLGKE